MESEKIFNLLITKLYLYDNTELFEQNGNETIFNNLCYLLFRINQYRKKFRSKYYKLVKQRISNSMTMMLNKLLYQLESAWPLHTEEMSQMKPVNKCTTKHCGNNKCKYKFDSGRCNKIKKWYICAGCKLIYFCSRKCQKYCWNRLNHKYHCHKLR